MSSVVRAETVVGSVHVSGEYALEPQCEMLTWGEEEEETVERVGERRFILRWQITRRVSWGGGGGGRGLRGVRVGCFWLFWIR